MEVARLADCPRSCVVGLTEIAGNERAGFTVIVAAPDTIVTAEFALSVTWSSNDHAPMAVRVPVEVDADNVHCEELPKTL